MPCADESQTSAYKQGLNGKLPRGKPYTLSEEQLREIAREGRVKREAMRKMQHGES